MSDSYNLAAHIRGLYFGGNWTAVHLRDVLNNTSLAEALYHIEGAPTILALAYHLHYFTRAQLGVLRGDGLHADDRQSFDHPEIIHDQEWMAFLETLWTEAREYCERVEQLDISTLDKPFVEERYGTYRSNIMGNIEHAHYHLGQITMLRRLVRPGGDGASVQ